MATITLPRRVQGAPVTASRDIPSVAIFFVAYEAVKRWLREGSATGELGTLQLLAAGTELSAGPTPYHPSPHRKDITVDIRPAKDAAVH